MNQAVMCIARDREHANSVVSELEKGGFSSGRISVGPDRHGTSFSVEHKTRASEGAATGAGTGGMVVGLLGLLVGLGVLAPGSFFDYSTGSGAIVTALSGLVVGSTVGGVTGALVGMGIPDLDSRHYQSRALRDGSLLVSVYTGTTDEQERAEAVFHRTSAEDVYTTSAPTFDPSESRTDA